MRCAPVFANVVLALLAATGCQSNRPAIKDARGGDESSRGPDRKLAARAADVSIALWERVEAGEALTPEYLSLLCQSSRRQYFCESDGASPEHCREALQGHWRRVAEAYAVTHFVTDAPYSAQFAITEYYLSESKAWFDLMGVVPPASDEGGRQIPMDGIYRPVDEVAREVWQLLEARRGEGEALTPEFVALLCEWSRRVWQAEEHLSRTSSERGAAAESHLRRLNRLAPALEAARYSIDGIISRYDYRYYVKEARLFTARASSAVNNDIAQSRRSMAESARAHFDDLSSRMKRGETLTPELVEEFCVWSRRACRAESASRATDNGTAASAHFRRLSDLHADLKARFDAGVDVSRVQVSQAAYYVEEAKLWLVRAEAK
jgi:hypothetical protein